MASQEVKEQLKKASEEADDEKLKEIITNNPSLINEGLDNSDSCSLHIVCLKGNLLLLKYLLSHRIREINKRAKTGWTPLMIASAYDHPDLVDCLLDEADIEVNIQDYQNGRTALMLACCYGYSKVVRILLSDERVDREKRNKYNKTAFEMICYDVSSNASQKLVIERMFETISPIYRIPREVSYVKWKRGKAIVVGGGRVGKTSLTRTLLGEDFKEDELSTQGVEEFSCDVKAIGASGQSQWAKYSSQQNVLIEAIALSYRSEKQHLPIQDSRSLKADFAGSKNSNPTHLEGNQTRPAIDENTRRISETEKFTSLTEQNEDPWESPLATKVVVNPSKLADDVSFGKMKYLISMFDFGGQPVFNIVHPFFLTSSAIYIIVFNMTHLVSSSNLKSKEEAISEVRFWLNTITVHAYQKIGSRRFRPNKILIVGTHADLLNPNEFANISSLLKNKFAGYKIWSDLVFTNDVKNLCFFPVDNKRAVTIFSRFKQLVFADEAQTMMLDLRTAVESIMDSSSFLNINIPAAWLKIYDDIKDTNEKQINFVRAKGIALNYGVKEDAFKHMLKFLHEMGFIMWHDEQSLRDLIILDAVNYFVKPITTIICDRELHHKERFKAGKQQYPDDMKLIMKGILTDRLFHFLLSDCDHRDFIKLLMMKYALLLMISDRTELVKNLKQKSQFQDQIFYIVPSLLPNTEIDPARISGDNPMTCYFAFGSLLDQSINKMNNSSFLPDGLFPRLVCRVLEICMKEISLIGLEDVHQREVLLIYRNDRFLMKHESLLNMISLTIFAHNPIPVSLMVSEQIQRIVNESYQSLEFESYIPSQTKLLDRNLADQLLKISSLEKSLIEGETLIPSLSLQEIRQFYSPWLFKWLQSQKDLSSYHFFISYRWGEQDTALVEELFSCFSKYNLIPDTYSPILAFLDRYRLQEGYDFREGFCDALLHSKMMIPIVTGAALERMISHNVNEVDNVLLEWILALHLQSTGKGLLVLPIVIGSIDMNDGMARKILPLSEELKSLPENVPITTFAAADHLLQRIYKDSAVCLSAELKSWSVSRIVSELLKNNTPFMESFASFEKKFPFSTEMTELLGLARKYSSESDERRSWTMVKSLCEFLKTNPPMKEKFDSMSMFSPPVRLLELAGVYCNEVVNILRKIAVKEKQDNIEKAWEIIEKVMINEEDPQWKNKLKHVLNGFGVMGDFEIFYNLDRNQWQAIAAALKPGPQKIFMEALNLSL